MLMGHYVTAELDLEKADELNAAKFAEGGEREADEEAANERDAIARERRKLSRLVGQASRNQQTQKRAMERLFQSPADAGGGDLAIATEGLYHEKKTPPNQHALIEKYDESCQQLSCWQWYLHMVGRCAQKILDIIGEDEEDDSEVEIPSEVKTVSKLSRARQCVVSLRDGRRFVVSRRHQPPDRPRPGGFVEHVDRIGRANDERPRRRKAGRADRDRGGARLRLPAVDDSVEPRPRLDDVLLTVDVPPDVVGGEHAGKRVEQRPPLARPEELGRPEDRRHGHGGGPARGQDVVPRGVLCAESHFVKNRGASRRGDRVAGPAEGQREHVTRDLDGGGEGHPPLERPHRRPLHRLDVGPAEEAVRERRDGRGADARALVELDRDVYARHAEEVVHLPVAAEVGRDVRHGVHDPGGDGDRLPREAALVHDGVHPVDEEAAALGEGRVGAGAYRWREGGLAGHHGGEGGRREDLEGRRRRALVGGEEEPSASWRVHLRFRVVNLHKPPSSKAQTQAAQQQQHNYTQAGYPTARRGACHACASASGEGNGKDEKRKSLPA
ncbi:hypothetical protein THAOC_05647 [Thalassiosira oceanica]|uniref:Uncharacterized protein n=1 Tax=Thalassiosira oceanica TaxID=159749 RepID=K0T6U9_THAOC|nr:hypothetical protein THAOC_05647 [Thalassiosira oceanica]|eukprot:EJK72784.1 hypothetical protein THAOC_05647 [Thalassiosira oceanica]